MMNTGKEAKMENTMVTLFENPQVKGHWLEMVTYPRLDKLWCKILWEAYFI